MIGTPENLLVEISGALGVRESHYLNKRERAREREVMSICEMVKTQKWYYLHNMRSAYFPIDRRLHRERERGYVHP